KCKPCLRYNLLTMFQVLHTLLVIMPTNLKILAIKDGTASTQEVEKIIYWGKLHAVRTCLGILAVIIFLIALN
ncbi:MAG: DUF1772 domain-containing protein, partial [Bacteriovoracaceae bacterium]